MRAAAVARQRHFVLDGDFNYADLGDALHRDGAHSRHKCAQRGGCALRRFTDELLELLPALAGTP